jgi:hypothetical protein
MSFLTEGTEEKPFAPSVNVLYSSLCIVRVAYRKSFLVITRNDNEIYQVLPAMVYQPLTI